jgi:hypothetical protein
MGINDNPLGVSGTTLSGLGDQNGALYQFLKQTSGGSSNAQRAIDLAGMIVPQQQEANPWEAAFQYFAEMGRQASQPGATALGAAVGSMQVPLDYLNAKKKEKRETDRARMQTALTLGPSLKPAKAAGSGTSVMVVDPETGKPRYMSSAEAIRTGAEPYIAPKSGQANGLKPFSIIDPSNLAEIQRIVPSASVDADGNVLLTDEESALIGVRQYIGQKFTPTKDGEGAKTPQLYNVSEENLTKLNTELGLTLTRDSQGNVLLTPAQFALGQSFVGPEVKPVSSGAGSQYERMFANVNDIGTRLADPLTASSVTQAEKNEYSANYQKLIAGGEYTVIENGQEVTKRMPGIDLSETTNLPTPEGLDLERIIEQRRQSFDQGQNTSATFGSRMLYDEGILRNVMAEGYQLTVEDVAKIAAMSRLGLGNIGIGPLAQQYHVAAQNWVAAQLRNESGAAINPSEYADALLQYFPVVGDDAATIKQKQALREEATKGMINSAGGAFEVVYPNGVQYLSYTSGEEKFEILNPQGYANELLAKTELGQNLFFKDGLMSKTTQALKDMLSKPNAGTLYTEQMLRMIGDELRKPERNP